MAEEHKFDARLAEGVAYFEQMLQIMPEDRTTLEFLVVAYDQLGEVEKGRKSLIALTKLLIKERDLAALQGLQPRLEACDDPEAKALTLKVKTLVAPAPELTPEAPKELSEAEKNGLLAGDAVQNELKLVEMLKTAGVLPENTAENVKSQLNDYPTDGRIFLISALQILEKENVALSEKCAAYLADKFSAPPIPLAAFEIPKDMIEKGPKLTMRVRGAIPFAKLGTLTLVAVLNPADEKLRGEFAAYGSCRFYLASAASVEGVLAKFFGEKEQA